MSPRQCVTEAPSFQISILRSHFRCHLLDVISDAILTMSLLRVTDVISDCTSTMSLLNVITAAMSFQISPRRHYFRYHIGVVTFKCYYCDDVISDISSRCHFRLGQYHFRCHHSKITLNTIPTLLRLMSLVLFFLFFFMQEKL